MYTWLQEPISSNMWEHYRQTNSYKIFGASTVWAPCETQHEYTWPFVRVPHLDLYTGAVREIHSIFISEFLIVAYVARCARTQDTTMEAEKIPAIESRVQWLWRILITTTKYNIRRRKGVVRNTCTHKISTDENGMITIRILMHTTSIGGQSRWMRWITQEYYRWHNMQERKTQDPLASHHQDEDQPTLMHCTCLTCREVRLIMFWSFKIHSVKSI
jgi:hypothetical protein